MTVVAVPTAGSMPVPRVATYTRLQDAVADAMAPLTPVVVVNRRADNAIAQATLDSTTPFPTIHQDPRWDFTTLSIRLHRSINERLRGIHGEGADAGRTVFGSVRFVPTADADAGAAAVVEALRAQGDVGVRAYGPVSFIARQESIEPRTTYSADDSGATNVPIRHRAELHRVVAERIERSAGRDAPDPASLLTMPQAAAADAIRGWLLSDALGGSDNYVEAQIRRLSISDVMAAVVDLRDSSAVVRRETIDPGDTPSESQGKQLHDALERHGVATTLLRE